MSRERPVNFRAAVLAGIIAGSLATLVEIFLWWVAGAPLPDILFRDARLAAAILMGRRALLAPAIFDWRVMAVATFVHFSLSIVYAVAFGIVVKRLRFQAAVGTGAVLGLVLYWLNMYGFTFLFPWFAAARGLITALAHAAFGATAAGTYVIVRSHSVRSR